MNFYDLVETELPSNLKLDGTWLQNKKEYWEVFLEEGLEEIPDRMRCYNFEDLVEALIAKLCVYDAMLLAARGSYIAFLGGGFSTSKSESHITSIPKDPVEDFFGGDNETPVDDDPIDPGMMVDPNDPFPVVGGDDSETNGGAVKKIITGPTEVEFFDSAEALKDFLSDSKYSKSVLANMFAGLCGLANKIGIKIPYCNDPRNLYNKRFKVGMANWHKSECKQRPRQRLRIKPKKGGCHGICRK